MNFKSQQLLKKNPSFKKVSLWILVTTIIIFVLLILIPWQQTIDGHGEVTTVSPSDREQRITAPMEGRLGKWYVVEGQKVKKGDPIVEILDLDPDVLSRLEEEKKAIELGISSVELAIKNAENNIDRHDRLKKTGASTQRIYEEAQLELVKYNTDLAKAKVDLAKVKVKIARQDSRLVKAPIDGTIVERRHGEGGITVNPTEFLANIVPDGKSRIVALWVKGMDAPLVSVGDKVMLQFEGWPAVQFSGWPEVAVGTFEGEVSFVSPQTNPVGEVKIFVKPENKRDWPNSELLRLGTKTNGWVLLKNVTLGYELWRRFNGFPININSKELLVNKNTSN